MAFQTISNVRIAAIGACVPKQEQSVLLDSAFLSVEEARKFVDHVGIAHRRIHLRGQCASDLCRRAAEKCIEEAGWNQQEIDLLIFASQSPDYILPATASVLHGEMGLGMHCAAFDISQGCSGWVYGMSVAGAMVQSGAFKKALLLVGDTKSLDSSKPIFGDAGTATLLEYDKQASPIRIDTRSDGKGYEHIIRRGGAYRHPFDEHSLELFEDTHGHTHNMLGYEMNGPEVFVFSITQVPKAIKSMLASMEKKAEDVDYFILHQANKLILEQIEKKCKLPAQKCPRSLDKFGNTSSAAIPLTMVTQLREQLTTAPREIIACGFGSGLSWGTLHTVMQQPCIPVLQEI